MKLLKLFKILNRITSVLDKSTDEANSLDLPLVTHIF